MIELQHLTKRFATQGGTVVALNDINLTIRDGDVYGIIGMSGAGKSTLVRCINMLERPDEGNVIVNGKQMQDLRAADLRAARREITMIFQQFNLLMQRTCLRNIMFPMELAKVPKDKAEARARELLELVGLPDKADAYPAQLSGGQKQRIAIARALATDPKVLLCDEATSALDPNTTHAILQLIQKINRELGITVVIITHQMSVVEEVCNRVAILDNGTVVEEGQITVTVEQQAGNGRYDQIVKMIENSEKLKSASETRAAALADKLVPYSLLGTAVTYALTRNATRAISILMVDFSCALKLSMPLAVLSAMRECGSYHITVKGGKYLEALANADTIVFDKTGTLTHATPTVVQVVPFGTRTEDEVLQIAACLEEHYPHSMANAVVQAAAAKGIRHDEMHSEVQYVVAHGIASQIGGEKAVIGSQHFVFEDEGCCIPTSECGKFDALPPEYSHLYLAIGGVLAGVICIADPLREEASEVLKQLRGLGIRKAVMMTGDNDRTASVIAKQVGVDHYYAEVLPEDKANFVEQEKAAGHTVIMLGDGINDSPALSAADVGIAISDGAAIAREIADVTIAADSLRELVILKSIANGLQKRTRSNYRFIMSFNSTLIVLGAMGILPPATSALLHNASTLGVSLKSMTNLLD